MKFTKTSIPDVILIEPRVYTDSRGFFFESYSKSLFAKHGIVANFVQDNCSQSAKGALRGLHYQAVPKSQAKLVQVTRGEVFDVVVDIRPGSPTFGRYVSEVLSAQNKKMLFIPAGFAHGFCALEDGSEFHYKVSDYYSPEHERGILWNDPSIAIPWPKLDIPYVLSDKDKVFPSLKEASL